LENNVLGTSPIEGGHEITETGEGGGREPDVGLFRVGFGADFVAFLGLCVNTYKTHSISSESGFSSAFAKIIYIKNQEILTLQSLTLLKLSPTSRSLLMT
jgi:hypothetical protein